MGRHLSGMGAAGGGERAGLGEGEWQRSVANQTWQHDG